MHSPLSMSVPPLALHRLAWWTGLLAACACLPAGAAPANFDPLQHPAAISVRATASVLLRLARAGERLVAVGERGTILLSDDQGKSWRQVPAPVSVSLTGVFFADDQNGWIVGHGQVVLHSQDGGQTWQRQLDGVQAARIELETAQADPNASEDQRKTAQRLVKEGADKPFLDVHFFDAQHGLVVGAYGSIFATADGGKTWRSRRADLNNPAGRHLYRLHVQGNELYLAGEQGALFHASGRDSRFEQVKTPYAGSFFGVLRSAKGDVLAYGLRGNLWRQAAGSDTWDQVPTPAPVTITSAALLRDGSIVMVDEAGKLLRSTDEGKSLAPLPLSQTASFTDVVQARDGGLALTSARGAVRIPPLEPKKP
jgi:photosystem II stability/assembly factor-like uncharacterized protein